MFRLHSKHDKIGVKKLIKYMQPFTACVELKRAILPWDKIAITSDGWIGEGTHYFASFSAFPSVKDYGYDKALLDMSIMENEESMRASEHYDFISCLGILWKINVEFGRTCRWKRAQIVHYLSLLFLCLWNFIFLNSNLRWNTLWNSTKTSAYRGKKSYVSIRIKYRQLDCDALPICNRS